MEKNNTKNGIRDMIITKALKDENFRSALLKDPKGSLEKEMGITIPETLQVRIIEEQEGEVCLVIPPIMKYGDELSETELESIAGGWTGDCPDTSKEAKCS